MTVDCSGRVRQRLNIKSSCPILTVPKLALFPSVEKDMVCFSDSLSNVYLVELKNLVLEKVIDNVHNFYVGNFLQSYHYHYQLICTFTDNRYVIFDQDRQTNFDPSDFFPSTKISVDYTTKHRNSTGCGKLTSVVENRVEFVSAALNHMVAKNSVINAYITKVSLSVDCAECQLLESIAAAMSVNAHVVINQSKPVLCSSSTARNHSGFSGPWSNAPITDQQTSASLPMHSHESTRQFIPNNVQVFCCVQ